VISTRDELLTYAPDLLLEDLRGLTLATIMGIMGTPPA
jgi:hypothetical protein